MTDQWRQPDPRQQQPQYLPPWQPQQGYQQQPPRPPAPPRRPAPAPAAAKRSRRIGCWVIAGFIALGGAIGGIAEALGSSPTPYQQCVTSIQQQDTSTQVIGYTPQCMALPLDQRQAAIKQATGGG